MLLELRVGHLALVEEITISLSPGLTVLTGETGAGKSLIAGALILLSGGKADKGLVRQGEDEAFVEGVFDLGGEPAIRRELKKTGIHLAHDNILVLRRELRLQGRSRILINGLISSLALLERIGSLLLTVQSQDQQRELSDPDFARAFLDAQLGNEELLGAMRHCWEDFHNCQEALAERMQEEELAKEQLDLWRYQHEELVRASLRLGEEEELNEALALKRHASSLKEGAARTAHLLSEDDDPVREKLGRSIAALQPLAGKSRQLEGILRSLQEAESIVSDAASELSRFLDDRDLDPVGLDELEFRKTLYEELHRKYRRNTLELQQLQELLAERIARQESAASDLHALTLELSAARARMSEVAESLNSRRTAGAEATATAARAKIQQLALPSLELEFRVSLLENHAGDVEVSGRTCQVTPQGCDRVELWIRTNPGERMGPVDSIASGGERSRIHLGLTAISPGFV